MSEHMADAIAYIMLGLVVCVLILVMGTDVLEYEIKFTDPMAQQLAACSLMGPSHKSECIATIIPK